MLLKFIEGMQKDFGHSKLVCLLEIEKNVAGTDS